MTGPVRSLVAILATMVVLSACGTGTPAGSSRGTDASPSPTPSPTLLPAAWREYYSASVAPHADVCRLCHVPDGVADIEGGNLYQLSSDGSSDFTAFHASWERLGGNNPVSRLLTMASGSESHSGGTQWPAGGAAYAAAEALLKCFGGAADCTLDGGGDAQTLPPLLGSMRGGHYWFDVCEGKPDQTELPPDPRTLVSKGAVEGYNVQMNAWWQTCQIDEDYPLDDPGTCGELRARSKRGYPLVASDGEVGAGHFFSGNAASSSYAFPANSAYKDGGAFNIFQGDYANMWQKWGYAERPPNYDQLVSERWGMPLSQTHNPYPLEGEDPNQPATTGGSGQLPIGLTQLRNPDGSWTGKINVTCNICHGGAVGTPEDGEGLGVIYGTNSLSDITVMFTDLAQIAPQQSALAMISQNKVRGTGNITNFQLFGLLTLSDYNTWQDYLAIQAEASTGTEDPPVWWNVGHRPAKFFDAGQVMSAKRIELSFHFPNTPQHSDLDADKEWILNNQQDSDAWIMEQRSPAWPEEALGPIDTRLAEAGAVLFHTKNLWADPGANPVARPAGGNGSCASCHGAYSPRYVNDPAYLPDPSMEGIAAYVTPIDIIDTDRARLDGNSQNVAESSQSNWFAYPDGPKTADGVGLCSDWNHTGLRGERELGYLAPPLYGVWATAPYFHNGSVPTVAGVLDSSARPAIWRRLARPMPAEWEALSGPVIMGYDYSLAGYDADTLGWKHEVLECGTQPDQAVPGYDCDPTGAFEFTAQDAFGQAWANGGLAWNLVNLPILTAEQIEMRKVYNTSYYSQTNGGHEFTNVLTDAERRALIEYLKTL